jgi:peptidoglycan hydrolase-like protein with peptidoglycan-binding domain
MSLKKAWVMFCIASFCVLAFLVVTSPVSFASATRQAQAQKSCPVLSYGSTDANSQGKVSILQRQLRAVGKEDVGSFGAGNAGVDGIFGSVTLKAVKHFQKTHGLSQDGVVGKNTWAALGGCGSTPPTKCETHSNAC